MAGQLAKLGLPLPWGLRFAPNSARQCYTLRCAKPWACVRAGGQGADQSVCARTRRCDGVGWQTSRAHTGSIALGPARPLLGLLSCSRSTTRAVTLLHYLTEWAWIVALEGLCLRCLWSTQVAHIAWFVPLSRFQCVLPGCIACRGQVHVCPMRSCMTHVVFFLTADSCMSWCESLLVHL